MIQSYPISSTRQRRRRDRRGYLYVAVLFTTLIVAGSIATAISLDTTRIKTQNAAADRGAAIRLAESELHRISVQLRSNSNWRDETTSSTVSDWIAYGSLMGAANASARYSVIDDDDDLDDDVFDDVRVVAHARFGAAQAAVSVELETGFAPLDLLRYGVSAFDDIRCENGSALVSENPIQVFDDCKTYSYGYITAPTLECSGSVELQVRGDRAAGNVQIPDFDLVSRYRDAGTEIPLNALTNYNGGPAIHLAVLSASNNPYGAVDPNGIYWINALGQQVTVAHARIAATIAIRNASRVVLSGAIVWEAAQRGEAILISDSRIEFESIEPTLDESAMAVNFNPPATPYRGVYSNSTMSDQFPTEFRGIIYTANDMFVQPSTNGDPIVVTGAVMCHDLRLYHSLHIQSRDKMTEGVPLGFSDPTQLRFKAGTFRRVDTL